jgi:hypothetical protein
VKSGGEFLRSAAGIALFLLIATPPLTAQNGVPAPSAVEAKKVADVDLARFFSTLELQERIEVGGREGPWYTVRILTALGSSAGLDCGCVVTRIVVAVQEDEEGGRSNAWWIDDLLDPAFVRQPTSDAPSTVRVEYGLPAERKSVLLTASIDGIRVVALAR